MKEKFKIIGTVILFIYGLGVIIFGSYFEWQFATENGFIAWLLLGWIVPAIKGFLWPLFIIF